ncbi:hypothetical protein TNCT_247831 [Trichonephila clavata]|uniref:Uncharacterized protein n=1 Tax=Trichonephila clavata TaxID=2740835 RepID=A0A8X6LH96_TRICU|nr:hypothetical protein TNCT_247831 [Trichonephila clavata]
MADRLAKPGDSSLPQPKQPSTHASFCQVPDKISSCNMELPVAAEGFFGQILGDPRFQRPSQSPYPVQLV